MPITGSDACCARAESGHATAFAAEQRDELAASQVAHGLLPGVQLASLPNCQAVIPSL